MLPPAHPQTRKRPPKGVNPKGGEEEGPPAKRRKKARKPRPEKARMTSLGRRASFVTRVVRGIRCYKPSEVPQRPQAIAVPTPAPAPAPSAPCRPRKRAHEEVTHRDKKEPGPPRKKLKRPRKKRPELAKVTRLGRRASFVTQC
ncbi:translation initiation factor IF-2-like [Tachyglossus aculeatus]|uniref:translation initiation factor IF-2-like n=1 Tax=Tachyglossus aculeatus TaxID=9261 RepID=UPI0018F43C45|nr:translation initiation factor IF-2-like [Tachyglossus aculeatus]